MINTLKNLISSLEYSYSLTLDMNFLTTSVTKYENLIDEEHIFSLEELMYIHYLLALCNDTLRNNDKSLHHFNLCLYYSILTNNETYAGKCYLYASKLYFILSDLDESVYYFNKAEEIFTASNNYCDLSKLYIYAIFNNLRVGICTGEVLGFISKTLNLLTLYENEFSAQTYMLLGSVYSVHLKDNYYAIELYKKASFLANKYNLVTLKIMINYFIAVGYIDLNRNNEGCKILENLLSDTLAVPSITMKCIFTLELLNLYITTESNIDYIGKGIDFIQENLILLPQLYRLQFISQLLIIKCRLGLLLNNQSIDTLLNWITKSKEIYTIYKTSYRFSHADYTINSLFGDIYYEFEHYLNALEYHKLALEFSSKYESKYVIYAHQKISKDYAALNNYKEAFINMEKVDKIRSTIQHVNLLDNYTKVYKEYEDFKENEETKNQFFANLSHELKTPINIIYSSIQLLNMFKDTNEDKFKGYYGKHEKSVTHNCLRILKLIDNLIDTTKIDSGSFNLTFVNYDIVKLIEDITLSTLPYIEIKKLNIIFDTEIEQLEIKCDPYAIERIMLNLLSNAIKFTNNGGNINVIISLKDTNVCIKVNDDGIGIPPSMRDQIFDKFIQVDNALNRKKEGSGIGLSLVKSIVELHNGRVYLNSTRMRGSEFIILLPNVKSMEPYDKIICNTYVPNTSKISAEFSDIYELN